MQSGVFRTNLNGAPAGKSGDIQLNDVVFSAFTDFNINLATGAVNFPDIITGAALHNNVITGEGIGQIRSGTYTPTISNVLNLSSNSPSPANYLQVGNIVTVTGYITIDLVIGGAYGFTMNLPITTTAVNQYEVSGVMSSNTNQSSIITNFGGSSAFVQGTSLILTTQSFCYSYSYLIE